MANEILGCTGLVNLVVILVVNALHLVRELEIGTLGHRRRVLVDEVQRVGHEKAYAHCG